MTVLAIIALVLVALWWFFREPNPTGKNDDTQSSSDAEEELLKGDIKPHTIEDKIYDIKKTIKQRKKVWKSLTGKRIFWTGFVDNVLMTEITLRVPYEKGTGAETCRIKMEPDEIGESQLEELNKHQIIKFSGEIDSGEISSTDDTFTIELRNSKIENIYDTIIECMIRPSAGEALKAMYRLQEVDDQ